MGEGLERMTDMARYDCNYSRLVDLGHSVDGRLYLILHLAHDNQFAGSRTETQNCRNQAWLSKKEPKQ